MALTQVKSDGIATGAVTADQIAANAVTVDDISDGSISTAKLADDAVTADKLANTAVTAGSYTLASVTVDAQGRITAASSGTAGDSDKIEEGNTSAEVVDTGSDGHFKVVTEGTEALRVDSSQQVGIGTASPQRALHVSTGDNADLGNISIALGGIFSGLRDATITKNTSSPYGLTFTSSNSGTTHAPLIFETRAGVERARLDTSGRLLLGTTSARAAWDITPRFQHEGTNHSESSIQLTCNSSSSPGTTAALNFSRSRGSAVGSSTVVDNGDYLGIINFTGADGTDINSVGAQIRGRVDATPGSNDMPGRLEFFTTADGASSPSERMRIDRNGKAYLGGNYGSLPASFGANGGVINITFDEQAGGNPGDYYGIISFNSASSTAYHYLFYTGTTQVGNISCSTSSTAYNTSSDYRMKENIVDLDGAIDRVKQLAPKRFNFTVDPDNTVDGFLAHEAQTVVPEAVTGAKDEVKVWREGEELPDGVSVGDNKLDEDGNTIPVYQGIDQAKLVPLLTAALQEAIGKIETLETANASQAATIAALDARLTALEA